jgi:HEPN domain-containing protein
MDWRKRVNDALNTAEAARARGNEGMARVCARRAAGWTVQAYLKKQGIDLQTTSVIKHMQYQLTQESLAPKNRTILEHMLVAKQKDDLKSDSYFPLDVDLVAEARQLIAFLFPE